MADTLDFNAEISKFMNEQNSPAPEESESIINSFVPTAEQSSIKAEISPAKFDNMIKVLNVLTKGSKGNDTIIIRNSCILQTVSQCIIQADMSKILNYQGKTVDLDILNPKKYVTLFSEFRNQNNIFIIDDPDNSRFIVTNGEIRLYLPKQQQLQELTISPLDYTDAEKICEVTISKDVRKTIIALAKDKDSIDYLLQGNQIKGVHISDTAIYILEQYMNDPTTSQLDETTAELTLRTTGFLPFEAESYDITLCKMNNGSYSTYITCQIGGVIDVLIMETLSDTTGGNISIF